MMQYIDIRIDYSIQNTNHCISELAKKISISVPVLNVDGSVHELSD